MKKLSTWLFCAVLSFFCAVAVCAQSAESDFLLEIDGVPCVADTVSRTLYSTILPGTEREVTVNVQSGAGILLDGQFVGNGQKVRLEDFQMPHSIVFVNGHRPGREDWVLMEGRDRNPDWKVVFTTLPVVSLDIDPDAEISKEVPAPARLVLVDAQQRTSGQAVFRSRSAVHWRGATASTFEKKSYTVALQDALGGDLDAALFGISADDKWVLDAMAVDFSRMRNRLCFDIWNNVSELADADMKMNGTVGYFVELILNGQYHGLYCLSNKVNRKLLGLKKVKGMPDGSVQYRGLLYKCSRNDFSTALLLPPLEEAPTDSVAWFDWDLEYPDDYPSAGAWQPLMDLMDFAGGAPESPEETDERLYEHFYEGNAVTLPVFLFACMLTDNMMHNTYLSVRDLTQGRRFWMTPWDLDASFGRDGWGNRLANYADSWNVFQGAEPFHTLFENRDSRFFRAMAARWAELREGELSVGAVCDRIDDYAALLDASGAWQRERERWNGLLGINGYEIALSPSATEEADYMKAWYALNFEHLQQMFGAAIEGVEPLPDGPSRYPKGIFTIDGRRVPGVTSPDQLGRGIYIIDGKKVVR